jgi:hypothetical protein
VNTPDFTNWRTSSRSSGGGNCVEVAHEGNLVAVRDTKDREGGTLVFPQAVWTAFIVDIRNGKFDLLAIQPK